MTSLTNKVVVTRKEHKCFTCLRPFPKGTKMNYWSGIYEGDFSSGHCCLTCVEIMNAHRDGDDGDGFPEGYTVKCLDKGETPEQYLQRIKQQK